MPPTPLAIATASVNRLLKEESTYRTELASQEQRIGKMKAARGDGAEGENAKWELRQETQAMEETRAVFGPLREKITAAVERVEGLLNTDGEFDAKEVEEAKGAVGRAKSGS